MTLHSFRAFKSISSVYRFLVLTLFASGELLGLDAVREFTVLRDSYRAEFGKHPRWPEVRRRFSHGLSFGGIYTFAKALDVGDSLNQTTAGNARAWHQIPWISPPIKA